MGVSVLILTRNEEICLPDCLRSVGWSDEVVVFDSISTDRTVEIARESGARVIQHAFKDYGSQREAALRLGDFRNEWVLVLDADERPDQELASEIREAIGSVSTEVAAFRMRRKDFFEGRWIPHATLYPSWFVRLVRHARARYEPRAVHEYPTVDGEVRALKGHLLHDSFAKGFEEWWGKHERYAELEAREQHEALLRGGIDVAGLVSLRDPVRRRRALKALSFFLPMRSRLRFLYMYVLRRGFLDGRPGYHYCRLLSRYEGLIVQNLRAVRSASRSPS